MRPCWGISSPASMRSKAGFARAVKADQANARFVQLQVQPGKHLGFAPAQMNVLQLPTLHRHESVPDVTAAILGSRPAPGQPARHEKGQGRQLLRFPGKSTQKCRPKSALLNAVKAKALNFGLFTFNCR